MKLLFVGSNANLNLNRIGGIESTIRELLFFLIERNNEIKVLLIDSNLRKETKIESDLGEIPVLVTNIGEARKHLLQNFDVINFIQTPFGNPLFALFFLFYKLFRKTITTKFFFTYPSLNKSTFLQKVKLKLLIDHTFVFSKRLEKEAKKIVKNVTFLYPPVSKHYINPIEKKHSSKKSIFFAGRLSEDKGLDIVIKVFKDLPRENYYLGLIGYFANKIDSKKYLDELNDLKLNHIEIVSHINQNQSTLPLNEYDLLLLPYQDIGPTLDTPLLILEGLSSKCKVITSNIEPLNTIDGNIYFVDDFTNYIAFVDVINKASTGKLIKNINDYSTNNFGNCYLRTLKELDLNV